jgi:hypothetical protein
MMLSWNPHDFQNVVAALCGPVRPHLAGAIRVMGSLPCPAPSWDAHGSYRVDLDATGQPEIQKLRPTGLWVAAMIGEAARVRLTELLLQVPPTSPGRRDAERADDFLRRDEWPSAIAAADAAEKADSGLAEYCALLRSSAERMR